MMGIGWMELMILIIALLVFLKPEELPRFFRSLGRIYSQIFGTYRQVVREINTSDVDYSFNRTQGTSEKQEGSKMILDDKKLKAKKIKEKKFVRPKKNAKKTASKKNK